MLLTRRLNIRPDERIAAIIRRSPFALLGPGLAAAACVFLAFFLITPLLARGRFGAFVFAALLIVGAFIAVRTAWSWYWNALVVTDIRVIDVDQRGLFHRQLSEARFEKIEDIAVEIKGIVATLFHLGTLRIQTAGAQVLIELRTVPRPELVQELLGRLQEEAGAHRPAAPAESTVDLTRLDDAALTELRERLDVEVRRRAERRYAETVEK